MWSMNWSHIFVIILRRGSIQDLGDFFFFYHEQLIFYCIYQLHLVGRYSSSVVFQQVRDTTLCTNSTVTVVSRPVVDDNWMDSEWPVCCSSSMTQVRLVQWMNSFQQSPWSHLCINSLLVFCQTEWCALLRFVHVPRNVCRIGIIVASVQPLLSLDMVCLLRSIQE